MEDIKRTRPFEYTKLGTYQLTAIETASTGTAWPAPGPLHKVHNY